MIIHLHDVIAIQILHEFSVKETETQEVLTEFVSYKQQSLPQIIHIS